MTKIVWDESEERRYETGLDRGVLYPLTSEGVPWNGLLAVNEVSANNNTTQTFKDGIKKADIVNPGNFSGAISAITYPDEFLPFDGYSESISGLIVANQPRRKFGLSYRTLLGEEDGDPTRGYKIHILYNLTAEPSSISRKTLGKNFDVITFGWSVQGTPVEVPGFRASAHLILDSTKMHKDKLYLAEKILYGTNTTPARMPTPEELLSMVTIEIIDHGDGTWSAIGGDEFVYLVDTPLDEFEINNPRIKYNYDDTVSIGRS